MSDRVDEETVVVGEAGGRPLRADLYRPPSPNGSGIFLIHGGSFARGDRRQLRGYAIALGQIGYTSVACEYRLAGEARWPAQIDDVHAGLAYLYRQAQSLGVDPAKIVVSGHSAGGCLALLAAASGQFPLAAAVAFYAPVDFLGDDARAKGAPQGMAFLLGDDVSEARLASMSPLNLAGPSFPPTLLITGNRDELVHWGESLKMYQALMAGGVTAEIHIFDGVPHAFDLLPEFGRQCAGILALFLDTHVLNPGSPVALAPAPPDLP
ncbi:MAG TPA: alpha/beta hydrolase [Acidimicrobiales bacterium]|nr:alpha/beta hydrolase [Acidimicrobiales bacterium]